MEPDTVNVIFFTEEAQENPNFSEMRSVINKSPTLIAMINQLPYDNLISFDAGTGSFALTDESGSVRQIVIDGDLFQNSNYSLPEIATLLGHELGHVELPGGLPDWSTATNPDAAAAIGLQAEAVALVNEYQVAQELGSQMYTDISAGYSLQDELDELTARLGDEPGL